MITCTLEQQQKTAARSKQLHDQLRAEGFSEVEISLIAGSMVGAALQQVPFHDRAALACGHTYAMMSGIVGR